MKSDVELQLEEFRTVAARKGDERVAQFLRLSKKDQIEMLAWMVVWLTDIVTGVEKRQLDTLRMLELLTGRIETLEKDDEQEEPATAH